MDESDVTKPDPTKHDRILAAAVLSRRRFLLGAGALGLATVAGCGSEPAAQAPTSAPPTAVPTAAPTTAVPTAAPATAVPTAALATAAPTVAAPGAAPTFVSQVPGFPPFAPGGALFDVVEDKGATIIVRHRYGETEIPKHPKRIYSDPSTLPTLFTLDQKVVGAHYFPDMPGLPGWDDYAAGAQMTQIVEYTFNYEEVAVLKPDLIIGYGNFAYVDDGQKVYDTVSQIAPTIVPLDDPLPYFVQAVRDFALVLGGTAAMADADIAALNAEVAAACAPLQQAIGDETVVTIQIFDTDVVLLGAVGEFEGKIISVTDSYWMYGLCGMKPPASLPALVGNRWAIDLSQELIPQIDADHIFVTVNDPNSETTRNLLASPIWQANPAVQNNRAYVIPYFSAYSYETALAAIREAAQGVTR